MIEIDMYKLFSLNFSEKFLLDLSVNMKEMTIGPGENIFVEGDKDYRFYFLNKGNLEIFKQNKKN